MYGGFQFRYGFGLLSAIPERRPKVIVRFRKAGRQLHRPMQVLERCWKVARISKHKSKQVMSFCISRIQLYGSLKFLFRAVQISSGKELASRVVVSFSFWAREMTFRSGASSACVGGFVSQGQTEGYICTALARS